MKKRALLFLILATICTCAGCFGKSYEADTDTIFVEKKGTIVETRIRDFGKDNYSEEELKSFVEQEVADYNSGQDGKPVSIAKFQVKDQRALLILKYNSVKNYQSLTGTDLFYGTLAEAQNAAYDFKQEFVRVENGQTKDAAQMGSVLERGDDKVVILTENVNLEVYGDILYVSAQNVQVTGKNTVTVQGLGDGQESGQAFVVFR